MIDERRKRERLRLRLPVLLLKPGSNKPISSETANISNDGFYCVVQEAISPGDKLTCLLALPAQPSSSTHGDPFYIEGQVDVVPPRRHPALAPPGHVEVGSHHGPGVADDDDETEPGGGAGQGSPPQQMFGGLLPPHETGPGQLVRSAEDEVLLGIEHGQLGAALTLLSPELRAAMQATVSTKFLVTACTADGGMDA